MKNGGGTNVSNTATITGLGGIKPTKPIATIVHLAGQSSGAARAAVDGALANTNFVLRNAGRFGTRRPGRQHRRDRR